VCPANTPSVASSRIQRTSALRALFPICFWYDYQDGNSFRYNIYLIFLPRLLKISSTMSTSMVCTFERMQLSRHAPLLFLFTIVTSTTVRTHYTDSSDTLCSERGSYCSNLMKQAWHNFSWTLARICTLI